MKHIVIQRPGSYQELQICEAPTPQPQAGSVLVQVEAIGVNYADCVIRMGLYESAKKYVGWPITPGFEVAGTIAKVGEGVQRWSVGDRVLAVTRFGGYTSHLVVPEHQVFALPDALSMEQAAGFPAVFLTAYHAMFALGTPRPRQRILVHSAAGGVGGALTQLGKIAECEVTGVVGRTHKVETAQISGAKHVIDKSTQKLWSEAERIAPEGFHLIFDANGVETLQQSYAHLAAPGKLVIYGFHTMLPKKGGRPNWLKLAWGYLRTPRFNPLDLTGSNRSVLGFNLSYLFAETDLLMEGMQQLLAWIEEGKLAPPPVTTYPMEHVADAHRDLESGQTVGKLILIP